MDKGYSFGGSLISLKRFYGLRIKPTQPYRYPKNHPCYGCPYTLNTSLPSCMFPKRQDGSCFWYDLKHKKRLKPPEIKQPTDAQKISDFIKILEAVKQRKGYY